jgi:tetratricopeptide (TPR) repeat protein
MEEKDNHLNQLNQAVTPEDNKPNKAAGSKSKRGLWVVLGVVILVVAGLWAYNHWQTRQKNEQKQLVEQAMKTFPVSRQDIQKDFVNEEKKLKSDVLPPQRIKDRFERAIKVSRQAIEAGKPSQPRFKDLKEDYLTVASSYSILGNYQQAEEWYLKMLVKWPKDYKANMNLGDLYILMRQYRSAAEKYLDTIIYYPHDFRIPVKFAELYVRHSQSVDKLAKADKIYAYGIHNADNPKSIYKAYASFLEYYLKDYKRALEMEREYQKITGSKEQQAIERLERLIH